MSLKQSLSSKRKHDKDELNVSKSDPASPRSPPSPRLRKETELSKSSSQTTALLHKLKLLMQY